MSAPIIVAWVTVCAFWAEDRFRFHAAPLLLGRQFPAPAVRWDHVVWGYIKMGRVSDAVRVAERVAREQPDNAPVQEALGYVAATNQQLGTAIEHYERAIALRPRSYLAHFNLAKAYLAQGERSKALREAQLAANLEPTADTEVLVRQLEALCVSLESC